MEFDVVRAWKDAHYRQSLTAEQQAQLPQSPVGEFELTQAELEAISGAGEGHFSFIQCQFTGGDDSQCPTFGDPNGFCRTNHETENNSSLAQNKGAILGSIWAFIGLANVCS